MKPSNRKVAKRTNLLVATIIFACSTVSTVFAAGLSNVSNVLTDCELMNVVRSEVSLDELQYDGSASRPLVCPQVVYYRAEPNELQNERVRVFTLSKRYKDVDHQDDPVYCVYGIADPETSGFPTRGYVQGLHCQLQD